LLGLLHPTPTLTSATHALTCHARLQVLLAVVEELLQQQTAAHVRAALSILGHVRFGDGDGQPASAAAASPTPMDEASVSEGGVQVSGKGCAEGGSMAG